MCSSMSFFGAFHIDLLSRRKFCVDAVKHSGKGRKLGLKDPAEALTL